jgi:DNA-3-methyladenine glycosylase
MSLNKSISTLDFSLPAPEVARQLIGAILLVDGVGGIIVETEAYDREDPASHSFSGITKRNAVMFGPPGKVYVYRSYGIHWCLNFVCREEGHGAGVLIRAIQPTHGIDIMQKRRGIENLLLLCSGPGRLGQALNITHQHNGLSINEPPYQLILPIETVSIATGPRIGITKARDVPWRFGLERSPFLSRPFPK